MAGAPGNTSDQIRFRHWDLLKSSERQDCIGSVLYPRRYGGFDAWEADGCLRSLWNDDILDHVRRFLNAGKIDRSSFTDRIRGRRKCYLPVRPCVMMLSSTGVRQDAKPHVVLLHASLRLAKHAADHLKKDHYLKSLGLTCIADRDDIEMSTGTPTDNIQAAAEQSESPCGIGIIACPMPLRLSRTGKKGTIGGVLKFGDHEFYGLTSAHLLFREIDVGGPTSRIDMSDDSTTCSEYDGSSDSDDCLDSKCIVPEIEDPRALYLLPAKIYGGDPAVLRANTSPFGRDEYQTLPRGSRLIGRASSLRASEYGSGIMYSPELDWALVEIDPQIWAPNHFIHSGRIIEMQPGYGSNSPPHGELLIVTGTEGMIAAKGIGTKTAIALPWTSQLIEVWQVIGTTGKGASGSWVIDPTSGIICGIVIAHSRDSQSTFMLPADKVFSDILDSWYGEYESVQQVFQLGPIVLPSMYDRFNHKGVELHSEDFPSEASDLMRETKIGLVDDFESDIYRVLPRDSSVDSGGRPLRNISAPRTAQLRQSFQVQDRTRDTQEHYAAGSRDSGMGSSIKSSLTVSGDLPAINLETGTGPPGTRSSRVFESEFRVSDKMWFRIGRVFTMLWYGNGPSGEIRQLEENALDLEFPGLNRQQTRKFAVVRQFDKFCWAVPISTYLGRGVGKPGFTEEDWKAHAVIHMAGTDSSALEGEPPMIKRPIAVENTREDRRLDRASRIRFDKVFTIEHSAKVKNVGRIIGASMPYFRLYWEAEAQKAVIAIRPSSQMKSDMQRKRSSQG